MPGLRSSKLDLASPCLDQALLVIASEAKQSRSDPVENAVAGLLRRCAPRNDELGDECGQIGSSFARLRPDDSERRDRLMRLAIERIESRSGRTAAQTNGGWCCHQPPLSRVQLSDPEGPNARRRAFRVPSRSIAASAGSLSRDFRPKASVLLDFEEIGIGFPLTLLLRSPYQSLPRHRPRRISAASAVVMAGRTSVRFRSASFRPRPTDATRIDSGKGESACG